MDFNITVLLRACASFAEGDLKYPPSCFSRGARAVQLRDGRQHPGPDGHVAQGQQAGRRRPRRQGQGAQSGHLRPHSIDKNIQPKIMPKILPKILPYSACKTTL